MDRSARAILILTLCCLVVGAYAFGVFLQQPLVPGEALRVEAATRCEALAAHEPVATGAMGHECSKELCRLRAGRPLHGR